MTKQPCNMPQCSKSSRGFIVCDRNLNPYEPTLTESKLFCCCAGRVCQLHPRDPRVSGNSSQIWRRVQAGTRQKVSKTVNKQSCFWRDCAVFCSNLSAASRLYISPLSIHMTIVLDCLNVKRSIFTFFYLCLFSCFIFFCFCFIWLYISDLAGGGFPNYLSR